MKIIKTTLIIVGVLLTLVGCHKDLDLTATSPTVSNEEIVVTDTQASISWDVNYVGRFQTGVEVSSHENMTDARRVEAAKEENKYVAIVNSLASGTKYYYRIVVWNNYGSFAEKVEDLETHKMLLIQASCLPEEGGSIIGTGPYEEGKNCTLQAICNEGYSFVDWIENGEHVSADADYSFVVSDNRTLVANFTLQEFTIAVTADPIQGGYVTGSGNVLFGQSCTVSAHAAENYIFINWTEDDIVVSTDANYTFTVSGNRTLVAHFMTQVALPIVTTTPVTDITPTTATGGGNVTSSGGASVIERGICWSVNPQPTTSDPHFYSGTGMGNYAVPMSNLIPGTTYFVRAYAINSQGTAYGTEVSFTTLQSGGTVPQGAINGLFSVSAGQQVYFSQGNLQYKASTNTWQFASNQYDYIGDNNSNISQTYSGWIDLFGWGTSGYNHRAVCYQPWSTSQTNSHYYAYGNFNYNLFDQTGQADWGYNAISNGGNQTHQWHTLTHEEWVYVFNTRTTTSGIRYAKAQVNNVNGVILLPDNWSITTYSLSNTNQGTASFSSNTISSSQWSTLESAGAVFLPAAGYRYGTSVRSVGSSGNYWSSSYYGANDAYYVYFFDSNLYADYGGDGRYGGLSVRLVRSSQ